MPRAVALKGSNVRLGVDTPRKEQAGKFRDLAISLRAADGSKQLDLVCKDRREFKAWATGLAYLCQHGPPAGIAQWRERANAAARASAVRRQTKGEASGSAADLALAGDTAADLSIGRVGKTMTSRKLRERIRGAFRVGAAAAAAVALAHARVPRRDERRLLLGPRRLGPTGARDG